MQRTTAKNQFRSAGLLTPALGQHKANDKQHVFVPTYALTYPAQVAYGDGHRIPAGWTGTVNPLVKSDNMTLTDVLYVPLLLVDLIFLSALANTNHATTIAPPSGDFVFSLNGEPVLTAATKDGLFWVDLRADIYLALVASVNTLTAQQWQVVTGHIPYRTLAHMARNGTRNNCLVFFWTPGWYFMSRVVPGWVHGLLLSKIVGFRFFLNGLQPGVTWPLDLLMLGVCFFHLCIYVLLVLPSHDYFALFLEHSSLIYTSVYFSPLTFLRSSSFGLVFHL